MAIDENHIAILSLSVLYLSTAVLAMRRDQTLTYIKHSLGLPSCAGDSQVMRAISDLRKQKAEQP